MHWDNGHISGPGSKKEWSGSGSINVPTWLEHGMTWNGGSHLQYEVETCDWPRVLDQSNGEKGYHHGNGNSYIEEYPEE